MSPIAPVASGLSAFPTSPLENLSSPGSLGGADALALPSGGGGGFGRMMDGLVSSINGAQTQADSVTNRVLLGDSDQLHQSVIAMQEASTALSLMVEVRNKLVESYQELMRMQV